MTDIFPLISEWNARCRGSADADQHSSEPDGAEQPSSTADSAGQAGSKDQPTEDDIAALLADCDIHAWADLDVPPETEFLGSLVTETTRMMLVGSTGLGKTLLAHAIAAGIASGRGFLNWRSAKRGRVLIVDGEMPQKLLKKRAQAQVFSTDIPPGQMLIFALSRAEDFAKKFPFLGHPAPLTSEDGQAFLSKLLEWFKPDVVIFDNIMSLLAGSQKEEDAWAAFAPFVTNLSNLNIGQVFLDHTGLDKTRQYGSNTKAWRVDTVGIMTPLDAAQQRPHETGFRLSFDAPHGKARRRDPENWDEYSPQIIRLVDGKWTSQPADDAQPAKTKRAADASRLNTERDQVGAIIAGRMAEILADKARSPIAEARTDAVAISDLVGCIMAAFTIGDTQARERINQAIPMAPDASEVIHQGQRTQLWRVRQNPNHTRSPILIGRKILPVD